MLHYSNRKKTSREVRALPLDASTSFAPPPYPYEGEGQVGLRGTHRVASDAPAPSPYEGDGQVGFRGTHRVGSDAPPPSPYEGEGRGEVPGNAQGQSAPHFTILARMSVSRRILISSPSTLISVPEYLPKSTSSPSATPIGARSPESSSFPGPTARTSPRCGFSLAVSGSTMPPAVFSSASICRITTRSSRGRILSMRSLPLGSLAGGRGRLGAATPALIG